MQKKKKKVIPFKTVWKKQKKSLEEFLVALRALYRAEVKREWTVVAFFQCKVAEDKGARSTLLVRLSGGTVPAHLAILDEQSNLSFGTLLKPPRGGVGNTLKTFGQIYS